jgi:hypothetical protein
MYVWYVCMYAQRSGSDQLPLHHLQLQGTQKVRIAGGNGQVLPSSIVSLGESAGGSWFESGSVVPGLLGRESRSGSEGTSFPSSITKSSVLSSNSVRREMKRSLSIRSQVIIR